ncbi:uncharacterized protein LOC135696502 [Rhopilema esculentum]|uniref:uncharacterized protein LOC135696502 n=1 Tax=Rhopilema esculentum TaxID=499914 RepID=UPI0031CDB143
MTRNRRLKDGDRPHKHKDNEKTSRAKASTTDDYASVLYTMGVGLVLALLVIVFVQFWSDRSIAKLYTPLSEPKMVNEDFVFKEGRKVLWGTYRPNLYFGLRTRTPDSLMFGMMFFSQYPKGGQLHLRYSCEQSDNLAKYGWLKHDGKSFGSQEVVDDDFILTTDFVKQDGGFHGGDWTARIRGRPRLEEKSKQLVSLLFIVSQEGKGDLNAFVDNGIMSEVHGHNDVLGKFKLKFPRSSSVMQTYLVSYEDDIYDEKNIIMKNLKYHRTEKNSDRNRMIGLPGVVTNEEGRKPNFFVHNVILKLPFEFEVLFQSGSFLDRKKDLSGPVFSDVFNERSRLFDEKFEKKFNLAKKGFSIEERDFAKAAMSNMIGGMGYFYGNSKVKSKFLKEPVDYWTEDLFTAVPSRSFFPRGFLWDEGFHQLLISQWDRSISMDAISHWLDLMNADGWIPREQILGREARKKVPDEFVVQHNENANPPTLFLAIQSILASERKEYGNISKPTEIFLRKSFGRLQKWFSWYNWTQVGSVPSSYRWRGRDAKNDVELNPKTLTSGLDDYPRGSHPTVAERHVDLRCWMALASGILSDIAKLIGQPYSRYESTFKYLSDNNLLDELHWSSRDKAYCDYGNHTKFVALEHRPVNNQPGAPKRMVRVVRSKQGPSLKFVPEFGYVSLFPFLLHILEPTSPKLKQILDDLRRPDLLWTEHGLRSLAKNSPMYMKRNTEHDPPYWRGPIWINMNYLAVRALDHYSKLEGPYQKLCKEIYSQLRFNLIRNIFRNYQNTGYIWEQYNDSTGKGQGCYPFTGWSALVTLMMAEIY